MTLMLTACIMVAFACVYAALAAMLTSRAADLLAALLGLPAVVQDGGAPAVSRRFSLA